MSPSPLRNSSRFTVAFLVVFLFGMLSGNSSLLHGKELSDRPTRDVLSPLAVTKLVTKSTSSLVTTLPETNATANHYRNFAGLSLPVISLLFRIEKSLRASYLAFGPD